MEYVSIDTNIFMEENFLANKRMQEFFKLSEQESIRLVLTRITIEEIKSNYRKKVVKAIDFHNEFKNKHESKVLRNHSNTKELFWVLRKKEITEEFNERFDKLMEQSRVQILEYIEIDIKDIFDKYFKSEVPFHKTDKKHEFPDAFALKLLEQWTSKENLHCTLFTMDKDFENYHNPRITISKDYDVYLSDKLKEQLLLNKRIEILEELYLSNIDSIIQRVKDWYEEKLHDESLYYHFVFNEIHNIEITEINVGAHSYEVVSKDEEWIEIEVELEVDYKVTLTIDDEDASVYDHEVKVRLYFDTAEREVTGSTTAYANVTALITDEDNYEDDFEIEYINKDVDFSVGDDTDYWY